ncbi:hypothetical protein FA15DRAFT_676048 [Coprinopsis marcescibilis]|uniref:Phosphatidylserine decarboxylase proenzyme 2 n=1 Tax=Coprinopsis marcescibilis TaxID=230819 RepID=A0A5C3KCT0_COPMA|nr:hypothetical protein FA15DRAFT_676048 [Coprinopsis marcescibilis]
MAPSNDAANKKGGLKIGKALKSAVLAPGRVATKGIKAGKKGNNQFVPASGEDPVVILRLQIIGCMHLLAKDRGGTSDPFVVASVLNNRQQTVVVKKSLNPVYSPKDATFNFPIYSSLADKLGVLELVVWDKDMLGKDYLGEVALPLEDWFVDREVGAAVSKERPYGWDDPNNKAFSLDLLSTRANTAATGSVQIRLGFVSPPGAQHTQESFGAIFNTLVKSTRPSLVSVPPTQGVGTVRSNGSGAAYEDDGGLSSDEEDDDDDDDETEFSAEPASITQTKPPVLEAPTPRQSSGLITKMKFGKKLSSKSTTTTPDRSVTSSPIIEPGNAAPLSKKKGNNKAGYKLDHEQDIVGIVMLEIQTADDLPKLSNMTRTGWDMDPFVVISFGKKVFRTRVIRHSRNPVWDEKLLFHVRRYETNFQVNLAVLDWDKLSANDHIGDANFNVKELLDSAPQPDSVTGLYSAQEDGNHPMKEFKLPLAMTKGMNWESKHSPTISVKARYQPYSALRQRFWRQYLRQYDTDDTNTLSHLEITSMLDSLGSTLTHSTVDSFFTRFGQDPHEGELSFEQAIQCLEAELGRPASEKRRIDSEDSSDSAVHTPILQALDGQGREVQLEQLDFSGQPRVERNEGENTNKVPAPAPVPTSSSQQPLQEVAESKGKSGDTSDSSPSSEDEGIERVINVKNCPMCHRPRLNAKAEMDIITHMAICASQDWGAVDKIMVGNFVTASQAQRKWYNKVLNKVSSGNYKLGANSANIIVQNRMTGKLEEEKMQVYVRLGIRLLYKGASSRMEGGRARGLLKSMSIKQGIKYDDPASAAEIPGFIDFHNLDVNEIRDPLDSFKTFNEFFYRKLKTEARPVDTPEDPYRLVSAADSRLMAFETVSEATRIWIKGRDFSVQRLFGDTYKNEADRYIGGALAIFRLAPQDYHRFHSPVDGVIGPMTYIAGEYYTVNPQAIRTALDVYGENARKIVPIDSPQFGRVMAVCVGAMMVGSIQTTVNEGQQVKRGDEFGYFAFGGSTIVIVFEKGAVEWDEDLLINGRASLETLVRVGMGVGHGNPNRG